MTVKKEIEVNAISQKDKRVVIADTNDSFYSVWSDNAYYTMAAGLKRGDVLEADFKVNKGFNNIVSITKVSRATVAPDSSEKTGIGLKTEVIKIGVPQLGDEEKARMTMARKIIEEVFELPEHFGKTTPLTFYKELIPCINSIFIELSKRAAEERR